MHIYQNRCTVPNYNAQTTLCNYHLLLLHCLLYPQSICYHHFLCYPHFLCHHWISAGFIQQPIPVTTFSVCHHELSLTSVIRVHWPIDSHCTGLPLVCHHELSLTSVIRVHWPIDSHCTGLPLVCSVPHLGPPHLVISSSIPTKSTHLFYHLFLLHVKTIKGIPRLPGRQWFWS